MFNNPLSKKKFVYTYINISVCRVFPGGSEGKESACNVGVPGLIPGSGRSAREGNGNPLQYSCLDYPHGQRSLVEATVHRIAGQEARVRTGYGTTDWFQIRKGLHQGCILSACWFNLYTEYIMGDTGLMKHKMESRLPGETSITSDMQMAPPLRHKVKN